MNSNQNSVFMRRLFFILLSLITITSCLNDGSGMKQTYTKTADFQYVDIKFFPDSTFFNTVTPEGFGFDVLNFYHLLDPGKIRVDGGFMLSSRVMPVSGNTEGLDNTYRSYLTNVKKKYNNNYAVYIQSEPAFMPEHDIQFPFKSYGTCILKGCFVTNTVEVADYVKANFGVGDKITLKATGYLNGNKTGETSIDLVNITEQKDSIVSRWTPFELESLGSIEYVDFDIISSKAGAPAYFCLDELTFSAELTY